MSKHGTDERGWPLVPVDPKAIPEGHEAVRVGLVLEGEKTSENIGGRTISYTWLYDLRGNNSPRLIIRPIPQPIRLPLSIVPHGWWITRDKDDATFVYKHKPCIKDDWWMSTHGDHYCLPPWIAEQLPAEWHELPWDQSAVQQTEGGEG